jgi:hypothetical protein
LTLMLSPMCASPRISCASEIVNDVPPPPEAVLSRSSRAVTASHGQPSRKVQSVGPSLTANDFNEAGKHCCGLLLEGRTMAGGGVAATPMSLGVGDGGSGACPCRGDRGSQPPQHHDLTTTLSVQNDRNYIKRFEAGFPSYSSKLGNQFVSEICKTDARDCSRKR